MSSWIWPGFEQACAAKLAQALVPMPSDNADGATPSYNDFRALAVNQPDSATTI